AGSARGRAYLSKGYEAFLFPERGVYRPGDTVRLGGFVRGVSWETPPPMPLELAVVRPDGRELLRKSVMSDRAGRLAAEVTIGAGWPSGRYRAVCRLPGARESLGSTWFCVADYVPRTLRMRLAAPAEPIPTSTPLAVEAHVEHLFGDPAAGLKAACRARYTTAPFRPAGWDDYRFGDARKKRAVRSVDPSRKKLDGEGNAVFTLQAPAISTPAAVRVEVEVEVSEPGGRTLAESLSRRLDPWPFYLGVRAPKAGVAPAEPATFRLAAVAPRGKAHGRAKAVRAALYRVTYSNVLRRRGAGRLEYDWTRHETLVMKREGRLEDGLGTVTMTARHPGPHRLVVESEGGCPATLDFHVRGLSSQWAVANPERLRLRLDRDSYRPGDAATLAIESPFGGTALVCVEGDGVVERRVVDLPEGRGTEEFIVDEAWRPNVYLTATLVRPVEPEDEWRPHRASGAVRLDVDCGDRGLDLAVESPGEVRPGREVEIGVRVTAGGRPEAGAAVILAAVDEGVLALTGHRTPSPGDFFYGARRLDVKEYDMFSRLAPELARWRLGKRAEPGGGEKKNAELLRRLNPIPAKRVRTVVLCDGTLTTDASGAARARFTLPEYLGELRVMAWAASGPSFGAADKSLPVRSPVMLRASWPRFLAPGDVFDVPVTLFNRTARDGRVEVTVSCEGPLRPTDRAPGAVDVSAGGEETVRLRLRAGGVGKAKARVAVSLGGESYGESVEIPVRPPVAFARDGGSAVIEGPGEREIRVRGDFVPGTGRCSIVLAASPIVELTGALDHLLDYPYGCVEQTTSQMVPLVYLRDLAELARPGTVGEREVEALLQAGFLRLRTMQTYRGGLAMWPGRSRPYPYGSLYAADVLVEARKAGWRVPGDLLRPLLDYISGEVGTWASSRDEKERPDRFGHAAYACYVLARAGRPAYAWMGRLEEVLRESDRDGTRLPVAGRFHLAAAYLAAGDRTTAKGFVQRARAGGAARATSGYLSSPVRRTAVMLSVLLDLDPDSARIPRLAHRLKKRLRLGRWGTTQENAFALMALGKYARRLGPSSPEATARVTLPDGATRGFQARRGLRLDDIRPGQSIRVRVEGPGKVHAFWHAEGVPTGGHAAEEDSGMAIRRTFLEATGKRRVGPQDLVQGRLYQVRLVLRANRAVDNAVITDLLPAGLEIENPRLRGSSRLGTEGVKQSVSVQHIERRDDRVLAFGRVPAGRSEFRYVVRAVTAGSFVLPAAEVSCMYDPGLYSVHGRGTVRVSR
ncbi:MAG: MG2 domain-containing protein, partial [Planctomycetota bacterium]